MPYRFVSRRHCPRSKAAPAPQRQLPLTILCSVSYHPPRRCFIRTESLGERRRFSCPDSRVTHLPICRQRFVPPSERRSVADASVRLEERATACDNEHALTTC